MDKFKLSKSAKAVIFGFCYYLILNLYLYFALILKTARSGIWANRIIRTTVYDVGLLLTLPLMTFSYEYKSLANYLLVLNALVWGLGFYAVLRPLEWKRKFHAKS